MGDGVKMRILYVGCGHDREGRWFPSNAEVTFLDIDPACSPDIVADMRDMGDVGEYEMVFSCHSLEHLYPHEVDQALKEFHRVLIPGGHAVVVVPDLTDVRPTEDVLINSAAGPVTGLDMIYGMRTIIPTNPHMAHHVGFTELTLRESMRLFNPVQTVRLRDYNLVAIGYR